MNYFLGIDAGGTKTKAVIIDENSRILTEANGGPANYHNIGLVETVSTVMATIAQVLEKNSLHMTDLAWCTLGIAGLNTQKDYQHLFKEFSTELVNGLANKLTLDNDTTIGLYSGTTPPGIVVICGTGSNVYGINNRNEQAFAGNWGHFLGDKGSGYHLAKRMFETVVEAYDGTGESTQLTKMLEHRLNIKSSADIVDWYNETNPSIHVISDFAPLVFDGAEAGDALAKELVEQSIKELGKAVKAVVTRLKMEEDANRIVMNGGLFESKYFRAMFEGHISALLKHVRVIRPLVSAAVGAAIMAKHEWEKNKVSNNPINK